MAPLVFLLKAAVLKLLHFWFALVLKNYWEPYRLKLLIFIILETETKKISNINSLKQYTYYINIRQLDLPIRFCVQSAHLLKNESAKDKEHRSITKTVRTRRPVWEHWFSYGPHFWLWLIFFSDSVNLPADFKELLRELFINYKQRLSWPPNNGTLSPPRSLVG